MDTEQTLALQRAKEARQTYLDGTQQLKEMQAHTFMHARNIGVDTAEIAKATGLKQRQVYNILNHAKDTNNGNH